MESELGSSAEANKPSRLPRDNASAVHLGTEGESTKGRRRGEGGSLKVGSTERSS